jgi:hypothetical protein
MRRAVGHAAFVYLAFPNDPTLANLSALYEAELRRRGISCDRLNPAHFHCSLVYLDGAEDTALERIWNNLGLPLMFRVELVEPIQMGGALALSVAPDPALVRLQSDLYRLALENGCTPDANDFSNPARYIPHVSLLTDMAPDSNLDGLTALAPGVLPFHLPARGVVVSRDEYDSVRTVHLPMMAGDRALVERGGPHVWPGQRNGHRVAVGRSEIAAALRGEVVFLNGSRRPLLLGEALTVMRGGPGSGHFGHAGRPGEVGGSAPGGGASTREPERRYGSKAVRVADAMVSARGHGEFTVKPGSMFDGYIAPDGRAISIRPRESGLEDTHADAAAEALKKADLPSGDQSDPQRWLQAMRALGFVRVTNVYNRRIALDFWTPLTRAARSTLTDYLLANRDTEVKYEANFNRGLSSWPHGGDTEQLARVAGLELRGGPGSGHFGHEGRPGQVGGSAPGMTLPEGRVLTGRIEDEFGKSDPLDASYIGSDGTYLAQNANHEDVGFFALHGHWPRTIAEQEESVDDKMRLVSAGLARVGRWPTGWHAIDDGMRVSRRGYGIDLPRPISPALRNSVITLMDAAVQSDGRDTVFEFTDDLENTTADEVMATLTLSPNDWWPSGDQILSTLSSHFTERHGGSAGYAQRGGPGSGHFGHEGRLGEIGGSQPSGVAAKVADAMAGRYGTADPTAVRLKGTAARFWIRPDGNLTDISLSALHHESASVSIADAGLGDMGFGEASDWMFAHGFARLTSMWPNGLGIEASPEVGRRVVNTIKDILAVNPGVESVVDEHQIGPEGARLLRSVIERGGPGSGHFGHEGRPGEVGGSAPGSGATTAEAQPRYGESMAGIAPSLKESQIASEFPAIRDKVEALFREREAGHIRDVYPPTVSPSHIGFGDYWLLRDGTVVEVESHDRSAQSALEHPGVLSDRFKKFFGVEPSGFIPGAHFSHEGIMLGLGLVRWSTSGTQGVSTGGAKITDEQASRISEMAGKIPRLIEILPWEAWDIVLHPMAGGATVDLEHGPHGSGVDSLLRTRSIVSRGGPGSGHFGHEGRLGEVGGSAPGDAASDGGRLAEYGPHYAGGPGSQANPLRLSGAALGRILQWSTSRYNEYSKSQAVAIARRVLGEAKERVVITSGSYTPLTAMTGSDYLIDGPGGFIAVGMRGNDPRDEAAGFKESRRYYFRRTLEERGGPGSGHFGHEGRPGEVGGSAPSGGGVAEQGTKYASHLSPRLNDTAFKGHKFSRADIEGLQQVLAEEAMKLTREEANSGEFWLAPDGTIFNVEGKGHEQAAMNALVAYYSTVLPEETKAQYSFPPDPDYPPDNPAVFVEYESANGSLRLGRITNEPGSDWPYTYRPSGWIDRLQEEYGLPHGVVASATLEAAKQDAMERSSATLIAHGVPSATGEGLFTAHGFIRVSRGSAGRENYVGIMWDRNLTPTDDQRSVLASIARYTMEADVPDADKGVVWERVNPEGRPFGAIADSGVVTGWPDREFTSALVGRRWTPKPLPWWAGLALRGGPGSGHFGHEGRPGEVGGSAPSAGGTVKVPASLKPNQVGPRLFFHGTLRDHLESIVEHGLLPQVGNWVSNVYTGRKGTAGQMGEPDSLTYLAGPNAYPSYDDEMRPGSPEAHDGVSDDPAMAAITAAMAQSVIARGGDWNWTQGSAIWPPLEQLREDALVAVIDPDAVRDAEIAWTGSEGGMAYAAEIGPNGDIEFGTEGKEIGGKGPEEGDYTTSSVVRPTAFVYGDDFVTWFATWVLSHRTGGDLETSYNELVTSRADEWWDKYEDDFMDILWPGEQLEEESLSVRAVCRLRPRRIFIPLEILERGGPGSGHFGHEGRPGEVGGSAPGAGAGITQEWNEGYLYNFRRAVADAFSPHESPFVPGHRSMNGWLVSPDGRVFETGFGNHDAAFADAIRKAGLDEEPIEGLEEAFEDAEGEARNLPDVFLDTVIQVMYDSGFIAVDEDAREGPVNVILAFKGRPPQTAAQRRAIRDMVLSGDISPEFEFMTPSGQLIGGDSLRAFEKAVGITMRGGPGSGHFGHAGRPGEVGGSAPGGGGPPEERRIGGNRYVFGNPETAAAVQGMVERAERKLNLRLRGLRLTDDPVALNDFLREELIDFKPTPPEKYDEVRAAVAEVWGNVWGLAAYNRADNRAMLWLNPDFGDKVRGHVPGKFPGFDEWLEASRTIGSDVYNDTLGHEVGHLVDYALQLDDVFTDSLAKGEYRYLVSLAAISPYKESSRDDEYRADLISSYLNGRDDFLRFSHASDLLGTGILPMAEMNENNRRDRSAMLETIRARVERRQGEVEFKAARRTHYVRVPYNGPVEEIISVDDPSDYPEEWIIRGGPGSGHFGHEGRPGQVGGSVPGGGGMREVVGSGGSLIGEGLKTYQEREYVGVQFDPSSAAQEAIRSAESDLYSRGHDDAEKAYAVDASGEVLIEKIGTGWDDPKGAGIFWTDEEQATMRGSTLTHSHPSGRAFSPEDIIFACKNHLAEIRAVGTDYAGNRWLYRFQPAENAAGRAGWDTGKIADAYGSADRSVYDEWQPQVTADSSLRSWAETNHGHEVMTRFSIDHPEVVRFYGREKVN